MKIKAKAARAPVKLLADVPELKPQPAPRPSTNIAKNATVPQLLAQAAGLFDAGLKLKAERVCWEVVRKRNSALRLGKQPADDTGARPSIRYWPRPCI